jgi:5-methylcytosine-specific restriction enzyme A
MRGFLLTYNPAKSGIDYFEELVSDVETVGEASNNWSCGNRTDLPPGSALFLMRLGVEPKGLVGLGTAVSWPHEELHWDPDKAARGVTSMFVDFRFTSLTREPTFWLDELDRRFGAVRWTPQSSGMKLPESVVQWLLSEWPTRAGTIVLNPEEVALGTVYEEGAVRRVVVNAYERNRAARAACVKHHGYACAVCDVVLADIYGPVAERYIHVHHIRAISGVGAEYQVDPIQDLRPVCPNCHSVLHLTASLGEIEDLRAAVAARRASLDAHAERLLG